MFLFSFCDIMIKNLKICKFNLKNNLDSFEDNYLIYNIFFFWCNDIPSK